ncbi:hypothetical protein EHLJMEHL_02649 [Vreelandella titanicae]
MLGMLITAYTGAAVSNENSPNEKQADQNGMSDYPNQPIRMIIPFAPGGPADAIGRVVATKLSDVLGTPVVVESRGGAGGVIGTGYVAKGQPDGYLIAMTSAGALAISASVHENVPFNNATDFSPIMLLANVPELLVVNNEVAATSLEELVELATDNPGMLNFASSGPGSMPHLAGEMLGHVANIDIVHVPYVGAGPAVLDLLGGQVDMMFADSPVLLPQVKAGALRAIAVGSQARMEALPEVPTMSEAGVPEVTAVNWYGIVAPPELPDHITETLNNALMTVIQDEQVIERMNDMGVMLAGSTPEAFQAYIESETIKWGDIVRASEGSSN